MKIIDLKNNAFFLACWHERFRPVPLFCFALMVISVILLTYFGLAMSGKAMGEIIRGTFYAIVVMQALVLLVQGSLFAWQMGAREKICGTLDFHRNSPEDVKAKAAGLILGSAWCEWLVFIFLLVCELPFALHAEISLTDIVLFNVSLALAGLFLHTAAAVLALLFAQKSQTFSPLGVFIIMLFLGPIGVVLLQNTAVFIYLSGLLSLGYIFPNMINVPSYFLAWQLPPIIIQALIVLPFMLFLLHGMRRIFCQPNSPVWSKKDVVLFCVYLLTLTVAFSNAQDGSPVSYVQGAGQQGFGGLISSAASGYLSAFLTVGILASLVLVPNYFNFSRLAILRNKKNGSGSDVFNDGASSLGSIMFYILIAAVLFVPYLVQVNFHFWRGGISFIIMSCYVLGFAGYLEYFRLSRFRRQKVFFITGLIVWWVLLPWLLGVLLGFRGQGYSVTLSPVMGSIWVIGSLARKATEEFVFRAVWPALLMAVLMWVLARAEARLVVGRCAGALLVPQDKE